MCTEFHHICKVCNNEFICNEPDYVCPTMNYDEEANVCKDCEKEYWESLIKFEAKEVQDED